MARTRRDEEAADAGTGASPRGVLEIVSRYRTYIIVTVIGVLAFVVLWFEPQALIFEKTTNEARPNAPAVSPTTTATSSPPAGTVAAGSFRSLEHKTTGRAEIIRLADGSHVLRFENLDTSNGPDLRVYLSELPSNLGWRDYGRRFVELGELKANRGDQNYTIPAGTALSKYKSAVIWCVRFTVGFGVAPLKPTT